MSNYPLAIIQARIGSTRLPGKSLLKINDRSLLEYVVRRVHRDVEKVVLALPENPADDPLDEVAAAWPCEIVRGSEVDVLGRFNSVLELFPDADPIVRVTGDNPLIATSLIKSNIKELMRTGADWAAHTLLPLGSACAVFRRYWLEEAHRKATTSRDREHVTLWIKRHPRTSSLRRPAPVEYRAPGLRLTVDTDKDLELIRHIYSHFSESGWELSLPEVIEYLCKNPHIAGLNSEIKQEIYSDKKSVLYTFNCGREWGHGHWHRCQNIARFLKGTANKKYKNYFLVGETPESGVCDRRKSKKFQSLAVLPSPLTEEDVCRWQIRSGARKLILDRKYTDLKTVEKLQENGCTVIGIEDRGTGRGRMDFVFDPNIYPDTLPEDRLPSASQCYGPRFALIDPRFAKNKVKKIKEKLTKVGLCFGGTDPAGLARQFVKNIVPAYPRIEFHLFGTSVALPHPENLINRGSVNNPALAFSSLDLMCISGGVIKFEVAALQLPAIIISQHEEQYRNSRRFVEKNDIGWPLIASDSEPEVWRKKLNKAFDYETRLRWASSTRGVVDGRGIQRLINIIVD
jgi:spore coat polysaccharide biosynthesis protein SpsF (cytidylyltransferase family)/spore coat polysaccharide biosynthesis predicted glycosyltransferase SpsG